MAFTILASSSTVGTTEYWVASGSTSKTDQVDDAFHQAWLDFGALGSGDVFEWRVVEKINAGTQRNALGPGRVVGTQSSPVVITGLILAEGWEVGLKKIGGADQVIAWSLRKVT